MNKQCPTSDRGVTAKAKGVGEYQRTNVTIKATSKKCRLLPPWGTLPKFRQPVSVNYTYIIKLIDFICPSARARLTAHGLVHGPS